MDTLQLYLYWRWTSWWCSFNYLHRTNNWIQQYISATFPSACKEDWTKWCSSFGITSTFPFHGRVGVISSNSTLVIHTLRFDDASLWFSCFVKVDVDPGGSRKTYAYGLQPLVVLSIIGIKIYLFVLSCIH